MSAEYQHVCMAIAGPAKNPKALFDLVPCATPDATGCTRDIVRLVHVPCDAVLGCQPRWLRLGLPLFDALRGTTPWILLVGDSDTRGLAFSLLQMLAESLHGRVRAAAERHLWLGENATAQLAATHAKNASIKAQEPNLGSRICHMDWQFNASGDIVARRNLVCKEQRMPEEEEQRRSGGGSSKLSEIAAAQVAIARKGYPMLGQDYNLSSMARGARGGVRISFVTITTSLSLVKTLRHLSEYHQLTDDWPNALYLQAGAWNGCKKPCRGSNPQEHEQQLTLCACSVRCCCLHAPTSRMFELPRGKTRLSGLTARRRRKMWLRPPSCGLVSELRHSQRHR